MLPPEVIVFAETCVTPCSIVITEVWTWRRVQGLVQGECPKMYSHPDTERKNDPI